MKKINHKILIKVLVQVVIIFNLISCSPKDGLAENYNRIFSVSGSTSVGPLMEKLSEEYEKLNGNVSIEINQVGSSAGIKDVINGVVEFGMSSRELKDEEKEEINETVIAYDGIALIINNNNPIENIKMEEIKGIYTGEITNWNQINGGEDSEIVVISREDGSGTRDAFQDIIGYSSENIRIDTLISNGNGGIKKMVEGNENAIAFVSFEYLDEDVKALKVDGIKANTEEVINKNYKISREFLLVNKKENEDEDIKKIKDFILSKEGQKIVSDNGLISVNKK